MRPTLDSVKAYYDERIDGKMRDFTHANPRIEAAIQTLANWAPSHPKRILEIGCGIGATAWRMARVWRNAEVVGVDVSPASIQVAKTCFSLPNLSFRAGLVTEGSLAGKFDFVVLMDTYEHIALADRKSFHSVIRCLLADEARLCLSFPTPALQEHGRAFTPAEMQPVDEDVTPDDILRLAEQTGTALLYYREVGIWQYGDYAHAVLGRYEKLASVTLRASRAQGIAAFKRTVKKVFLADRTLDGSRLDYLGSDVLRPLRRNMGGRFDVKINERRRLASLWTQTKGD